MKKLIWFKDGKHNWGDYLSPILAKHISGDDMQFVNHDDMSKEERYIIIGSLMEHVINPETIVWGIGFMWENGLVPVIPKEICAVRGKLTRAKLLNQNIKCPEIYGDPALLFPRFYNPTIEKKYRLGIIPHYIDKDNEWLNNIKDESIKILNICEESYKFIDSLKECDKVISSSLHGLIAADAYNIPSMWIKLSNNVNGNGFKFKDYFSSVNRKDSSPYIIENTSNIEDVYKVIPKYNIDIDLDLLYNACPFKK